MEDITRGQGATDEGLNFATKGKQMPRHTLYHITRYDQAGVPIECHEDHFNFDYNALSSKLRRHYSPGTPYAGKPVWLAQRPATCKQPSLDHACNHPGCPYRGTSPEELRLHQRAYHREWYQMERERMEREGREGEVAMLREQNQLLAEQARLMREQMEANRRLTESLVASVNKNEDEPARRGRPRKVEAQEAEA